MYDIIELNKKLVTELRDIAVELDIKKEENKIIEVIEAGAYI